MKLLLLVSPLLAVGCHSRQNPPPPPVMPVAAQADAPAARLAATVGHYTLGAYVDPDDNLIRHEAHGIQRLEREARWDLRPLPRHPALAAAPTASALNVAPPAPAPDQPVALPVDKPADSKEVVPPVQVDSETAVVVRPPEEPEVAAVVPNADGLIDLTVSENPVDQGNPFAVRVVGQGATREITLAVGGIVRGASPCALINGRLFSPGDVIECFPLVRLETDAVLLRHEGRFLRLPVAGKPVRVKVAL